jgi:hypothetical protein
MSHAGRALLELYLHLRPAGGWWWWGLNVEPQRTSTGTVWTAAVA